MPNINPTLNVPQAEFLQLKNKFRAFVAGFGCMHGDTLVATAFGFKKIKEITSPTLVLSWSHKSSRFELALSGGAFPKGEANLYRVLTEQGEFVASGHHRLLCADGTYRSVEGLSVGEKVFASSQNLQQTNLGEFPLSSHANDQRSFQRHASLMGRYADAASQYGQQLLAGSGIAQDASPLHGGAQQYDHPSAGLGGLVGQECLHIHHYQQFDRHAMSDLNHRAWRHDLSDLNCLREECFAHALQSSQSHLQSLLKSSQDDSLKEFDGFVCQYEELASFVVSQSNHTFVCSDTPQFAHNQQASQSEQPLNRVMQDCKFSSQDQSYNCSLIKACDILSITQLDRVETYYDMQVLDNNNYVTIDGAIHHNSGKTWVGCSSLCDKSWEFPKVPLGYFAPTYPQIRDIFFPTIDEVAFDWGLKTKIYESNKEVDIYYGRQYRSTIICRSMEKPQTIVGFKIGHALIDELDVMPTVKARQAWRKIIARMRFKQAGLLNGIDVATTPEGFKFTYEQFVKEANSTPAKRALYGMIQASTYDNEANLPDDYISSLYESYPPQLISAYLRGQFVNLTSGAVYPDFDRKLNHTDEEIEPLEPLIIGMDFNVLKMAAVVYVIRDGKPLALDEMVGVRDTPTMAQLLIERFPLHEMTVIPDAAGQAKSSKNSSESDHQILRDKGFRVEVDGTNPAIKDRINAVNALILNGDGERTLRVNTNKCPRFTETLEQQVYDDFGMPDKKSGLDHVGDAGGYPIAKRFPIIKPVTHLNIPIYGKRK